MLKHLSHNQQSLYKVYHDLGAKISNTVDLLFEDRDGSFNKNTFTALVSSKFNCLHLPDSNSGKKISAIETSVAYLALGDSCLNNGLAFSVGAQAFSVNVPLFKYGSNSIKSKFLESSIKGEIIIASAITEKESGSDAYNMKTTAVKSGNEYVLNGSKYYITNAPIADYFLVYAFTDVQKGSIGGLSAFLVDAKEKGVEIIGPLEKMGLRTAQMGGINLNNVRAICIIGEEGSGTAMFNEAMTWERTVLSALNLGIITRVTKQVQKFGELNYRGGKRLIEQSDYNEVLNKADIFLSEAWMKINEAAIALDENSKQSFLKASVAKAFVAENGERVIRQLQQSTGAYGYLSENVIERDYRDFLAFTIYSGSQYVQNKIISSFSR